MASRTQEGCARCWPEAADAAWAARARLSAVETLVDESHFIVTILACAACGQRFLSTFTETVDWVDGEDPQYRTLLPLTDEETADLVGRRDSLTEAALAAVGGGRRRLRRDFPKGADEPRVYWSTGTSIGRHD
jgi:hypothetical protein